MLRILNAILFVFIPVMQRLVKYHAKLVVNKRLDQLYQTEEEVNVIGDKFLSNIFLYNSELIDARRSECFNCEFWKASNGGGMGRCGICKCFIKYKTRVRFESCPDNPPRWDAVDKTELEESDGIRVTT